MKVLLTGNNGYIGTVMSRELKLAGHDVYGLDTNFFEHNILGDYHPSVFTLQNDVRDVMLGDLSGFDAVIHLAGLSNDPLGSLDEQWTYEINYEATVRLAQLAKMAGVSRFLFASSCSMYGAGHEDDLLDEECPQKPLTAYAKSKVKSEEGLGTLADHSFHPVYFRCATAYGVSPRLRTDLVLNAMVAHAYTTGKIQVHNGGNAWRPIVHIEDISQAFILGLQSPIDMVHNQAFNVGSTDENYRVIELASVVRSVVKDSEIKVIDTGEDTRSYRVDFTKIKQLGFEPQWNALLGAHELLDFYKKVDFQVNSLDWQFIRLNQLQDWTDCGMLDEELRWYLG